MLTMFSTPKMGYRPSWSGSTILRYRHPWVKRNATRDGLLRNLSLAKLSASDRGKVEEQLEYLLTICPKTREGVTITLYERLAESYFTPFSKVELPPPIVPIEFVFPPKNQEEVEKRELITQLVELSLKIEDLKAEKEQQGQAIVAQQAKLTEQDHLIGRQELKANKLCTASLEEALQTFAKTYNPQGLPRRRQPISTARRLLERIGNVKLRNITAAQVDEFLDTFKDKTTQVNKRANLSVFFRCCKRRLFLVNHPFNSEELNPRPRVTHRDIQAIKTKLELEEVLDSFTDIKWKAWVAFACLAGPRKTGQLLLQVKDIYLDTKPPTVTIPRTKTRAVTIPIERNYLLPILQEYMKTWRKEQKYVWENREGEAYRGDHFYYHFYRERARGILSPKDFIATEKEITKKTQKLKEGVQTSKRRQYWGRVKHPTKSYFNYGSREFRHTFGTLLAKSGYDLYRISQMMANSPGVVATNYLAVSPVDSNLKGVFCWHD